MAAEVRCTPILLNSSVGRKAMGPSLVSLGKVRGVSLSRPHLANPAGDEKLCVVISSRKQRALRCSLDGFSTTQQLLLASSMPEVYLKLGDRLFAAAEALKPDQKHLVGLAGPPGAGKSTLGRKVVERVNELWRQKAGSRDEITEDIAIALPMDGYHLYRWQLDAMEDPVEAHARRGAPWTFNPAGLVEGLLSLRVQGTASFPSFDHGVGDPVEDDIVVTNHHRVVLVEGNYLLLDEGPWKELAPIFDETWFIKVDIDESMKRVKRRHISTGLTPDRASWRVSYNDQPNAELIAKFGHRADVLIPSIAYDIS